MDGRLGMRMFLLLGLFLFHAQSQDCPSAPPGDDGGAAAGAPAPQGAAAVPRTPRSSPALADIIGLDEAKAMLREAVVLPASLDSGATHPFWRSSERSAVVLVGPPGLGKGAAAEAAAAAIGGRVLRLPATEATSGGFCRSALAAANATGRPVVVVVEALEAAPDASRGVQQCLREVDRGGAGHRVFVVATLGRDQSLLAPAVLQPFGFVAQLSLPGDAERKQYLHSLLREVSRVDPQWASALREAAVVTLANLTENYTFAEIDLVVRRVFLRSTSDEGARDPVALHHFEQVLAQVPPMGAKVFSFVAFSDGPPPVDSAPGGGSTSAGSVETKKGATDNSKKKSKDVKDPLDNILGWCNFWLPEAMHLPPVVWAMLIFGTLAHFMARAAYQPHANRRRRGGHGTRSSLFGDLGGGPGGRYPPFGDQMNDWYPGGSSFANFPPPGMPRAGDPGGMFAAAGASVPEAVGASAKPSSSASSMPSPEAAPRAQAPSAAQSSQ